MREGVEYAHLCGGFPVRESADPVPERAVRETVLDTFPSVRRTVLYDGENTALLEGAGREHRIGNILADVLLPRPEDRILEFRTRTALMGREEPSSHLHAGSTEGEHAVYIGPIDDPSRRDDGDIEPFASEERERFRDGDLEGRFLVVDLGDPSCPEVSARSGWVFEDDGIRNLSQPPPLLHDHFDSAGIREYGDECDIRIIFGDFRKGERESSAGYDPVDP